jgi:hypothetical protein
MALSRTVEAIILTSLFAFLILAFSVQFLTSQNPAADALSNSSYGLQEQETALNGSLESFKSLSDNAKGVMNSSAPAPVQFVFLIFEGAMTIPKMMLGMTTSLTVLGDTLYTSAGGGWGGAFQILLALFLAILVLRLVWGVISAIRTGVAER